IFGEDICNQIPGCVGEFIPLCHLGLLALMAVYFTENRISWVYVQSLVFKQRCEVMIYAGALSEYAAVFRVSINVAVQ
ncbi:hypothetical protein TU85_26340, partial [Pseudomonas helleri]|uniref:hypothetical protein n=1 Tax=Pseudomonas helleri TaxID=1608996 RepID=UPI000654A55C